MTREEAEKVIQEKLAAARQLLIDAGSIAETELLDRIDFMGLTFEPSFGWFMGDELKEPSEWNHSSCVIGSKMSEHGTMDWQSSSWCAD